MTPIFITALLYLLVSFRLFATLQKKRCSINQKVADNLPPARRGAQRAARKAVLLGRVLAKIGLLR